jgi:hypothetical protein
MGAFEDYREAGVSKLLLGRESREVFDEDSEEESW